MHFKLGERVWWWSHGGGSSTSKEGRVVAKVRSGSVPNIDSFRYNHRIMFKNLEGVRDHESYLVEVDGPTLRSCRRLYHPKVSVLQRWVG